MEKEQTIKGILDNRNITSQVTYLDAAEYFDRTFKQEPQRGNKIYKIEIVYSSIIKRKLCIV